MSFIKQNSSSFKNQLIKEAQGLKLLKKYAHEINIPKVFEVDAKKLVMTEIRPQSFNASAWKDLAFGLSQLHKIKQDSYGLDNDNYIGLNPQRNVKSNNWGEFFYAYRLEFQISLIKDSVIKNSFYNVLENIKDPLINFLNEHCKHSSLVHGDLWSGNVLFDGDQVWLIDPAVYFGDREVDIAMSEMFGGFDQLFYEQYNKEYPLSEEYLFKKEIYNLYHYLNHYNLFGSSYLSSCKEKLKLMEDKFF